MILFEEVSLLQNPTMPLKSAFSLQVARWKMCPSRLLGDGEQSSLLATCSEAYGAARKMGREPGRLPRSHPEEVGAQRCRFHASQ